MNALATIRQAPGLDRYLDLLEHRLEDAVGAIPGRLGEVGADTLAAGGKRLRPLLVFLSTPAEERDGERAVAGGAAVELVAGGCGGHGLRLLTPADDDRLIGPVIGRSCRGWSARACGAGLTRPVARRPWSPRPRA